MNILKYRFSPVFILSLAMVGFFPAGSAVAAPTLPNINTNNVVSVTSFGAVGDGVTTNTAAIQAAINAAATGGTTNGAAGGTVQFPPGIYLSGPLTLKSSVNLQLDTGAILRMLPFGQYPVTWTTNSSGYFFTAANFISGSSLHDIEISGSGWIQGQGEPWWPWANTNGAVRPIMIRLTSCNRALIQSVTLSNSPEFHISISGSSAANTTVQNTTIRANCSCDPVNPGHNTDACDTSGTSILVQNNNISVGDDNFTCGGNTSGMLITNNTYGNGHGCSIGSFTNPSVSNMTVINCTFTNTDAGIRIKSDRDRGGYVHDINYYNLTMSNVRNAILIYTEYTNSVSMYRALDSISPAVAASYPSAPMTSTTPRYRNITISNLTATAQSGRAAGLLWGLPESCFTNITLVNVHLTDTRTFGIYDAKNVQIIDCTHNSGSASQYSFFNTDVTFSNSTPSSSVVTLDGATTNAFANHFSFYNSTMTLKNTNALGLNSSVTLGNSTFTISNNFALTPSNALSFVLGTNSATIAVIGNLSLGGTNNIIAGNGFTNGAYTLMTYTGTLSGSPTLGSTPPGYNCTLDTSTPGQVNLIVSSPAPSAPSRLFATPTNLAINLNWSTVASATGYNLKRSLTNGGPYSTITSSSATNYSDAPLNPGAIYYYVVSATNSAGESANSAQASAIPSPSSTSTNISLRTTGNQLQVSWPADHLGWRLQIQTNGLTSTNWVDVPNSTLTNQIFVTVDPTNPSEFLRLIYP